MMTGLFLGAGASYEVGMPLTWELTTTIKQFLTRDKVITTNANWRIGGSGLPDEAINGFISILENPAVHYEALIGYIEIQKLRRRNLVQAYEAWRQQLLQLVYGVLCQCHIKHVSEITTKLKCLDGIIGLAAHSKPLWVFSLNHDMIIESLAVVHGVSVSAGMSKRDALPCYRNGKRIGELLVEVITGSEIENPGLQFLPHGEYGINLIKIHGGLDIFTQNDGRDIVRVLPTETSVTGVIDALRAVNEDLSPAPITANPINEIAYVDSNNTMQFLRRSLLSGAFKYSHRGDQVMPKEFLGIFRDNLNYVQRLVCIGYAGADTHINDIIRNWLEASEARILEFVSPNAKEVPSNLLHLAPQVKHHAMVASEYLKHYSTGL